ncbi:MAG: hypothetical protein WC325_10480 [Candidatus Bathyarchaeia archaeon]
MNKRWAINLPWKLREVFICDLIGHKPLFESQFISGLALCERCMATLKKIDGAWVGEFAINDIKAPIKTVEA